MWVQLNTQTSTVPDKIGSTFNPASNPDFMRANGWREIDEIIIPTPLEGFELVTWIFAQDPENENKAIIQPTWELIADRLAREAAAEAQWQLEKSPMLKTIENTYIDFLTNDWTPMLRDAGLIAADYTITVANTNETQNMTYLLTLRVANKSNYYIAAGEFERFKMTIEKLGGIMSKVQLHT